MNHDETTNLLNAITSNCNSMIRQEKNPYESLGNYNFQEVSLDTYKPLTSKNSPVYDVLKVGEYSLDDDKKLIMIHNTWDRDRTFEVRPDGNNIEFIVCDKDLNVIDQKSTDTFYG